MSDTVRGHFVDLTVADDRTAGGLASWETIGEMDRELTKVIEDFGRAVDIEALRLAKENGRHLLSQAGNILFSTLSCRTAVFARAARTRQSRL